MYNKLMMSIPIFTHFPILTVCLHFDCFGDDTRHEFIKFSIHFSPLLLFSLSLSHHHPPIIFIRFFFFFCCVWFMFVYPFLVYISRHFHKHTNTHLVQFNSLLFMGCGFHFSLCFSFLNTCTSVPCFSSCRISHLMDDEISINKYKQKENTFSNK